jgi:hypothetical protein
LSENEQQNPTPSSKEQKVDSTIVTRRSKVVLNHIVRGWSTDINDANKTSMASDDVSTLDASRKPTIPSEPDAEPPNDNNMINIRMQGYGPNIVCDGARTPIVQVLLEQWRCRLSDSMNEDNYNHTNHEWYEKRVSYDAGCTYRVIFQSVSEDIAVGNATAAEKPNASTITGSGINFHHRFICLPFGISSATPGEDGTQIETINELSSKKLDVDSYWASLSRHIRYWKTRVDTNDTTNHKNKSDLDTSDDTYGQVSPEKSTKVTLILLHPIPLDPCSEHDAVVQSIVKSKLFHEKLTTLCKEIGFAPKYHTLVFDKSTAIDNVDSTSIAATPQRRCDDEEQSQKVLNGVKHDMNTKWWKPQYTIDYCFESMIEVVVRAMTGGDGNKIQFETNAVLISSPIDADQSKKRKQSSVLQAPAPNCNVNDDDVTYNHASSKSIKGKKFSSPRSVTKQPKLSNPHYNTVRKTAVAYKNKNNKRTRH